MVFLWVGLGGFLGANARYFLGREILQRWGMMFPYGTMIVNVTGAFLIGVLLTTITARAGDDHMWRQLAIVGFLGGYTTFSSFAYEAVELMQAGRWAAALMYIGGSNVLGLLAFFSGIWTARIIGL